MNDRYYWHKDWMSKPDMWIIFSSNFGPLVSYIPDHALDRWLKLRTNEDVTICGNSVYKVGR